MRLGRKSLGVDTPKRTASVMAFCVSKAWARARISWEWMTIEKTLASNKTLTLAAYHSAHRMYGRWFLVSETDPWHETWKPRKTIMADNGERASLTNERDPRQYHISMRPFSTSQRESKDIWTADESRNQQHQEGDDDKRMKKHHDAPLSLFSASVVGNTKG